jgi:hypothetical protein
VPAPDLDPYLNDGNRWGVSLAQNADFLLPCLDAAGATSVMEVGAFAGDLTRVLAHWAAGANATVGAIDPSPQAGLVQLAEDHPEVELIRETSLEALPKIPLPDAIVLDGDHNWWTVSEELRIIAGRAPGAELPLVLFHDVCWPHARRDDYFDASLIPAEHRQPVAGDRGGIFPGEPGIRPGGGLPYPRSADHEGGPENGVLTAVEDFVQAHDGTRLAVVPAFFGLGVLWHTGAPWAGKVANVVDAYDRHPVLERLEANRVFQLASAETRRHELWREQEKRARQEAVLRRLLDSSAFRLAERLSKLRVRAGIATGSEAVSRDEVRRALGD